MFLVFYFIIITIKSDLYQSESEPADIPILISPNVWKTTEETNTIQYIFTGIKFQIQRKTQSASDYEVYLDGQFQTKITQVSDEFFISKTFPYGNHTIKLVNFDRTSNNDEISYWLSMRAKRINIDQFIANDWTPYKNYIFTQKDGSYASISLQCSKIWVFGAKYRMGSVLEVQFGNHVGTYDTNLGVSDYNLYFELLYESPAIPLSFNELKLIYRQNNRNNHALYLTYIYILDELLPSAAAYPVSVPVDAMEKSDIHYDSSSVECKNEESLTPCGYIYKSYADYAFFQYTFTGVRFQIFGTNDPNYGHYRILLDDKELAIVNQMTPERHVYKLQYTSDILQYGEHKIRVENIDTEVIGISKFTYWPSLHAKRINFTQFSKSGSSWDSQSDKAGGVSISSSKSEVTFSTKIESSKFWIIGSFDPGYKKSKIDFGQFNAEFDEERQQGRLDSTVVYESPQFQFISDELKITTVNDALFNCIFYIDEPESEIPISASSFYMKFDGTFDIPTYASCPSTEISTKNCGQTSHSKEGYTASYMYIFTGVRFQVFGTFKQDNGRFSIYLDGDFYARIDQRAKTGTYDYSLLYTSNLLPYGEHSIKIINDEKEKYSFLKITYWVSMKAKRINATDFIGSTDSWQKKSDYSGGIELSSLNSNSVLSTSITCRKFWVIGSGDSISMNVKYDKIYQKIEINKEKVPCTLFYESQEMDFSLHEIILTALANDIKINCIYYLCDPPPQTQEFSRSVPFTKSELFSYSSKFSNTDGFSNSIQFTKTDQFSQSGKFSKTDFFSQSNEFSKTDLFSQSNEFSKTDLFLQSLKLNKTDGFSRSSFFSGSKDFSETTKFSNSNKFSNSFYFSESSKFSNSNTLPSEFTFSTDTNSIGIESSSPSVDISNNDEIIKSVSPVDGSTIEITSSPSDEKDETTKIDSLIPVVNSFIITEIDAFSSPYKSSVSSSENGTENYLVSKNYKNKTALIIGVVVGVVVLIALIIIIVILILKRRQRKDTSSIGKSMEGNSEIDETSANNEFTNPLYNGFTEQNDPFLNEFNEED